MLVLVPQFEGLAAFRLSGHEVDEVRSALAYTVSLGATTSIAGFSFGAGPALLARRMSRVSVSWGASAAMPTSPTSSRM